MYRFPLATILAALLFLLGTMPAAPTRADDEPAVAPDANDAAWHGRLEAIASTYRGWGRVDDQARWAPWLCRMPDPGQARYSESPDEGTHGRKLYLLYAMDPEAYGFPAGFGTAETPEALQGIVQAIVKESWTPAREASAGPRVRPAVREGDEWHPGTLRGLYVMFRLAPETPGTDEGWVYGTLTPGGEVTGSGRMASCMGCHVQAPRGRLFGVSRGEGD